MTRRTLFALLAAPFAATAAKLAIDAPWLPGRKAVVRPRVCRFGWDHEKGIGHIVREVPIVGSDQTFTHNIVIHDEAEFWKRLSQYT